MANGAPGFPRQKKSPVNFLVGFLLLLPLGIEVVEDRLAGIRFVDQVVQCADDDVGVHVTVVRHERADAFQPCVEVFGVVGPREHELAKALECPMVHDVADAMIGGQVIVLRLRFHVPFYAGRKGKHQEQQRHAAEPEG